MIREIVHALIYTIVHSTNHLPTANTLSYPHNFLEVAFQRFKLKVFSEHFVPYKFYPRRSRFEPSVDDTKTFINKITISEASCVKLGNGQYTVSREAYLIRILQDGTTTLEILSPEGGIHAFDTLAQLFYAHSATGEGVYTPCAPVLILDAPAFEHRGLNLDISRNWIAPKDVLRTIEAMGFNKFNKLHLHATDAQSWPLEIPALPDLSGKGAYREDQVWTTKDLENVQRHGLYHGVEVYLEVDLPGHTASIFHSYPDLITAYNKPWDKYAQEPPSGQLKLNSPSVPPFLTTLFNDLLPRTQPFSTHFHIGGDEINREAYVLDPTVKSSSKAILQPLLQKFMNHVLSLLETHALTPIVWEDMLLEWDLKFPPDTIIQTWRSASSLAKVVEKGHRALFGPCEEWYLDCGFGTFIDPKDPGDPNPAIKYPYRDWCAPYKNWRQILSYDPLADIPEEKEIFGCWGRGAFVGRADGWG